MVVGRSHFDEVLAKLSCQTHLGVDCETDGLRSFHGNRLFSIILADGPDSAYYMNFMAYSGLDAEYVLLPTHMEKLKALFSDPTKTWYGHNFRFDLHMLAVEDIEVAGSVHCTQAGATLEDNTHLTYGLDSCAQRIGEKKDDAVEAYIVKHHLWDWITIPGKKARKKDKYFYKVPFPIIAPYGERDATLTYRLGQHQEATFQRLDEELPDGLPLLHDLHRNEKRLTKTVVRMEKIGIKIDREYCMRAARYESDRASQAAEAYGGATGFPFKDSGKNFAKVFAEEKAKWVLTDKGNPSFESSVLKTFEHPAAQFILDHRDAKSKGDFYGGFLYHADRQDVVHPNWNQSGAPATGRFSSSDPNFQNQTREDWGRCSSCNKGLESVACVCPACGSDKICHSEFLVRRALIPREGFFLGGLDYQAVEYRVMFDIACRVVGYETEIVKKIKAGFDPHQAMADAVTASGFPLTRTRAKNANFAKLYGAGPDTFAETAGCSVEEGRKIMRAIDQAAPEIARLVAQVTQTARVRGYIFNWAGRRLNFPDPRFAYKAANYICQSGSADITKIAMNRIDEMLLSKKSRLIGTIHDELIFEISNEEGVEVLEEAKKIAESVYPYQYLPLTCSTFTSKKSMADWE